MKKYIITAMLVLLLPAVGYAKCCCCCCVEKYFRYNPINPTFEEEVKPQRLTVESERLYLLWGNTSKYSCVRCGKKLACSSGDFNYYCTSCKTMFNIKEE